MSFYDSSEYELLRLQISKFFKPIKEGNGHIAVGYHLREIGKTLGPDFQNSSKKLELGIDHMCTINRSHRG